MADTKVSALTATTTATDDDLLYLVDDPGGTPASKKITVANFITSIQGTGSGDCAAGNHTHTGVYEPADATILKDADIGVSVAAQSHNHAGVYEPANANIQSHISSTSNPHSVTKTQVGLSAVTNDAQLKIASNLSDLADAATARTNLGVATGSIVAFVPLDSTGLKGALRVDFACTITVATTIANATGSCVIDIKKSTYAGYPTTTSICASAKPTLSSARKAEDTTLTGWTTSITAGDVLEFYVDSASGLSWASVTLKYSR